MLSILSKSSICIRESIVDRSAVNRLDLEKELMSMAAVEDIHVHRPLEVEELEEVAESVVMAVMVQVVL
jgi:hypothetical protein